MKIWARHCQTIVVTLRDNAGLNGSLPENSKSGSGDSSVSFCGERAKIAGKGVGADGYLPIN